MPAARGTAPGHRPLVRIRNDELVADTAQSSGMQRLEAISGKRVGAAHIWMGRTHVPPGARSADHHHGPSETGIHVISGHPVFVFHHDGRGSPARNGAGRFRVGPAFHTTSGGKPRPGQRSVVVIARSTQEAIVVNLPGLF